MQRIDLLIVASLVVAVAGSAWGVLAWEEEGATLFDVDWVTSDIGLPAARATHAGAGEAALSFDVAQANLTSARVVVTIEGGVPRVQPTDVLVQLAVPGLDETLQKEAQLPAGATPSVEVAFDVDLADVPDVGAVRAASAEAALAQLAQQHASLLGTGTWNVVVSFAPTAPGPLADEAHAVTVQPTLTAYEARVAPDIGEVGR